MQYCEYQLRMITINHFPFINKKGKKNSGRFLQLTTKMVKL